MHRKIWEAAVGENLMCERQLRNIADRYAMAVKKISVYSCIKNKQCNYKQESA